MNDLNKKPERIERKERKAAKKLVIETRKDETDLREKNIQDKVRNLIEGSLHIAEPYEEDDSNTPSIDEEEFYRNLPDHALDIYDTSGYDVKAPELRRLINESFATLSQIAQLLVVPPSLICNTLENYVKNNTPEDYEGRFIGVEKPEYDEVDIELFIYDGINHIFENCFDKQLPIDEKIYSKLDKVRDYIDLLDTQNRLNRFLSTIRLILVNHDLGDHLLLSAVKHASARTADVEDFSENLAKAINIIRKTGLAGLKSYEEKTLGWDKSTN